MKGKSALTLLLAGIFSCGTCQATGAEVTSESVFNILNSTGAATDKSYLSLNPDKYPNYRLLIHSAKLQNEIKSHYTNGFAPIFPDTCYHLTHYWPAAADIPVASDNPVHYAGAIRYNARTPLQGSLLPLTRLV